MWTLRVLSGPQAGQVFTLNEGSNIIGRAPGCDIKITSPNVSKQHLRVDVFGSKVVLIDLGSSNGTFVNGVQIKSQVYRLHDKIVLFDVVIDIVDASKDIPLSTQNAGWSPPGTNVTYPHQFHQAPTHFQQSPPESGYDGNLAYQSQATGQDYPQAHSQQQVASASHKSLGGLMIWLKDYFDDVVLPGVYMLPELMEFKWVLACFVAAFIFFVTTLSSLPMMAILKASVEEESQRRALTIARTISNQNQPALSQGLESAVSVDFALREPGVEKALIIKAVDGSVIAPASQAGSFPDLPFIHEARKLGKVSVEQINDDTIGAMVPIEFYNVKTGTQTVSFYSVIIYNMGTLAVDNDRTLSLFIQTFFIAIIVGGILFFFMLKLIEFPIETMNRQLDQALKDGSSNLSSGYLFPQLQSLIGNINSTLSRVSTSDGISNDSPQIEYDRGNESSHLVELIGFPAIAIHIESLTVTAMNYAFEERTGINPQNLVHASIDNINDQALKLSIQDLIERCQTQPDQMITNDLEIGGNNFQVSAQAVFGNKDVNYIIVVLIPTEEGEFE